MHIKKLSKYGSLDAVSLNYDLLYSGMRRIKIKVKPNHREVFTYQSLFPTLEIAVLILQKKRLKCQPCAPTKFCFGVKTELNCICNH
jgi:hypothetical protein